MSRMHTHTHSCTHTYLHKCNPFLQDPLSKQHRLADLEALFHLPIGTAAKRLGLGVTILKRACRTLGVERWPYRKVWGSVAPSPFLLPP